MSTRLFPVKQGAQTYRVSGIAARCDWVLMSDPVAPHTDLRRLRETDSPRHIFLSLRAFHPALKHFAEDVLPRLKASFVLISGSEDVTLPRQTDQRYGRFSEQTRSHIDTIRNHPLMQHWFCENLDTAGLTKMSPLPLGLLSHDPITPPRVPLLGDRPLRIFCAHRLREGAQWQARRDVTMLVRKDWAAFTTLSETPLDAAGFDTELTRHSFALCVEGGGLDPSPKAWQSLLMGTIPIIRETALRPAYQDLPVIFVPEWSARYITPERLAFWRALYRPLFDSPAGRAQLLNQLGIEYWWRKVLTRTEER